MSRQCDSCGASLRPDVAYCGRCGDPVGPTHHGETAGSLPTAVTLVPASPVHPIYSSSSSSAPATRRNRPQSVLPWLVALTSLLVVAGAIAAVTLLGRTDLSPSVAQPGLDGQESATGAASHAASPTPTQQPAEDRLDAQVLSDAPAVDSVVGYWVPQVSSKTIGTIDSAGVEYGYTEILAGFQDWRRRYADAVLLRSGDFTSFRSSGYWVVVVARPFADSAGANRWCDQQGLARDDCFAKRLSRTDGPEGNTEPR